MPAVRVMPVRSANVIWKGLVVMSPNTASHRVVILLVFCWTTLLRSITAAAARDVGITIFGWGLLFFGVLNVFNLIRMHFDEQEQH